MTTNFNVNLQDINLSVVEDLSYPGRPLLIAFGGMAGSLGLPPFEFFNVTQDLAVNKIYMRDLSQTWYHSWILGISKNIDETTSFLQNKIYESGTSKVIVAGNSMGGYAALIFGILIRANVVHAFSPHTNLNQLKLIRNKTKMINVHNNYTNEYFDIKKVMKSHKGLGMFNLYFDSANMMDSKNARYLKWFRNVTLHSFAEGGHQIARVLRDSGELRNIIISSLNDVPSKGS